MMFSVLVVDDHAAWRERVCLEVQNSGRWTVVGQAADGREAVRQAHALDPDLILLDIGLPVLSGIEAARQIIARKPLSRILFLSDHGWDVAEAAVAAGARGYLRKTDGAERLLAAMDAVMAGVSLVSAGLDGDIVEKTLSGELPQPDGNRHIAAFYADETARLDDYLRLAEGAHRDGRVFVLVADGSRHDQLDRSLRARGIPVDRLASEGRHVFVDVATTLASTMADGRLDEARLRDAVADIFEQITATAGRHRLRIIFCAEDGAGLWNEGQPDAAVQLERLWNELSTGWAIDTLCAYDVDARRGHGEACDTFRRICAEHTAVLFRRSRSG